MRKRLLAAGLIAATLAWAGGCRKGEAPSPDVWAQVNGTNIQRSEVEQYYRTRVNPQGQMPSHEEALSLMLNILDDLINNEILLVDPPCRIAGNLGLQYSPDPGQFSAGV